MKIYATVINSRGKKDGVGDDKWLEIELSLGNKRIGRVIFDYQGGRSFSLSYEKVAIGRSSEGSKIIDSYDFDCVHSFREGNGWRNTCYHCGIKMSETKKQKDHKPTGKCEICNMPEDPDGNCGCTNPDSLG